MRHTSPFQSEDLVDLGALYSQAAGGTVRMVDVHDGYTGSTWIGVRHDCDNVIAPAVEMARWEYDHGYRSTYYVLHTAPYWNDKPLLRRSLAEIAAYGHEIGIHNDALTVALQTGQEPVAVLYQAIEELRAYGHTIRSTVAHGHRLCGIARYVNDEMFLSCARPKYGAHDRVPEHDGVRVTLAPVPLGVFGLEFDANWLARGDYLSDSGGTWSQSFSEVARAFPDRGQLHMLVHPDWWAEAFVKVAA